jgi:hypothetical protein
MRAGETRRGRDRDCCVTSGTIAAEMVGPLAPLVAITLDHLSGQLVARLEPGKMARSAPAPASCRSIPR